MDKAAAAFGIDPVDIRRRNLIDKFPYTSATGLVFDEASYKETLEMAVEGHRPAGVPRAAESGARARPPSRHRLCHLLRAHRLRQPGFRRARHGDHARLGDGDRQRSIRPASSRRASAPRRTARACAPRWRRSSPTRSASRRPTIKVVHGDTDRTPYGWGTFASRSLVISGGATLIAARKVRAKLIKIASHLLEAAPDDIVLEDGAAKVAGTDRSVAIAKMAREAYHADAPLQGRDRAGPDRDRHLRSARHVLQRLPRRHRRGRRGNRARRDREISGRRRTPAASSIR